MADNAFEWARARGRLRVNEVHGVEEADVPLDETWSNETERGRRIEFSGAAEMEVPRLTIFCVLPLNSE